MRLTAILLSLLLTAPLPAQEPPAATVNGEPIPEATVARALRSAPAEMKAKARKEVIAFLADNLLLDQHVRTTHPAPEAELEQRMKLIKEEAGKNGMPFEKLLTQLNLTEVELKNQVAADLRWEKFCKAQLTDAKLTEFFQANREAFDGSMVNGRHILAAVAPEAGAAGKAQATAKLKALKQAIERQAAAGIAQKTPAGADALMRNTIQLQVTTDTFAAFAAKESDCPSKARGGDLGSFPRIGKMVEPFAKAAFALQPGQVSDVVETDFGCHLILTTSKTAGKEVKFEEVKDHVFDICAEKLREQLLPALRAKAQIKVGQ